MEEASPYLSLLSFGLVVLIGQDFFPYVDAGQMRLHVRCPTGTRIEEAERIFAEVEAEIRRVIPASELDSILDNIGLPNSGINLAFSDSATVGNGDGEILISLKEKHRPTPEYTRELRHRLGAVFPAETFFFQPADITSQILNFGLPSPIDVQVTGNDAAKNYQIAEALRTAIAGLPGAVDVFIRQPVDYPTVKVNVDRVRANEAGLTQRDVASSLLISLSSSGQVAPNQWLNPINGVNYQVAVQTPTYKVDTFDAMQRTPVTAPDRKRQPAIARESGRPAADHVAGYREPLRCAAGDRCLRDPRPARSGRLCGGCDPDHRQGASDAAARNHDRPARPGGDHADFVQTSGLGNDLRSGAGVPGDGGQFSVVAGSVHHPHGAARRDGGHAMDAVPDGDNAECAQPDGRDHVHRCRDRQQHPAGHVCER